MGWAAEYLLGVCAAAMVCAAVTALVGKKGTVGPVVKLMTGCFMLLTLLTPLGGIRLGSLEDLISDVSADADAMAAAGENSARQELVLRITERTQAYILDKAAALGADVRVQITVSDDDIPVPSGVTVSGSISPYAKKRLEAVLTTDLGISEEAVKWN